MRLDNLLKPKKYTEREVGMGQAQTQLQKKIQFHILSDKQHAQEALDQAEKKDRYLEECNDSRLNRMSRASLVYAANRMTYHDLKYFEVMIENVNAYLPPRLIADLNNVYLVPLMPSADAGMPHTRPGEIICYPDISRFSQISTLIHELWHVHQRLYQDLWDSVFHEWGWTEGSEDQIPARIESSRRYNPDTVDEPIWVWRDTWIPIPVFKDISRPRVDQTEIWFIHIKDNYHVRTVPEEMRVEYPNAPPAAFEHPREMAAYLLSEPTDHMGNPGYERLLRLVGHTSLPMGKQSASTK